MGRENRYGFGRGKGQVGCSHGESAVMLGVDHREDNSLHCRSKWRAFIALKHQEAAASPASVSVDVEVLVLGSWLRAAAGEGWPCRAAGMWRGWWGSAALQEEHSESLQLFLKQSKAKQTH